MSEDTTRCVICTGEHAAAIGYLCEGHHRRLGQMLADVEDEACRLTPVPSMQIRTDSGGGSLASERSPARLEVLAFTDPQTRRWTRDATAKHPLPAPKAHGPWCLFCEHQTCTDWRAGRRRDLHDDEHDAGSDRLMSILGVLHSWARLAREERGFSSRGRITVTGERAYLARQMDWMCEQPWIDEFYGELRQLVSALRELNGTAAEKPVGRCYLPAEHGTCDGPVWLDQASGHAYCGRCRETWDGPQLAMLSFELERAREEAARPRTDDGRKMLTAQEIADQMGTTVNAVRLRLSRARIKAVGSYYHPDALSKVTA